MVAPCRYCGARVHRKDRSAWQYDHVEPNKYVGAANIVIACMACNKQKQQRTPAEAGMVLHRPGWTPGQADWSAPPRNAERSTVEDTPQQRGGAVMVEAGEDANPVEGTPSGQVESSSPWNPSSPTAAADVDLPSAPERAGAPGRGGGGEDPVGAHAPGQVEPAPAPRPAAPVRPAPAPAAAATARKPAAAAAAAQENVAAAAAERVSTRARACQGREGQGRVQEGEGPGREADGAGRGLPASSRRRRPRRKRRVRDPGASHDGTQPMPQPPPGSPGMAGPAPTPQLSGSFGSP